MGRTTKKVTAAILSMSLLTVMAGAAIAPALGIIKEHFAGEPQMLVQLIVSIPALTIIITNFCFFAISRRLKTRTIALLGLAIYVLAGAGCFFATSLPAILALRALLGVSVGLIMPLSTGLLAYYYPPEEQARLMGLAAAMNQMGGVVATLLAGLLATVHWNYAFLVYLLGLLAAVLVAMYLPNADLSAACAGGKRASRWRSLLKFHPSVIGMLLLMMIFFIFPTNFAIAARRQTGASVNEVTAIMVGLDVVAFFVGLGFGWCMREFRRGLKYFASLLFAAGYGCFIWAQGVALLVVGAVFIGLANGVGVPYLNTIASIKGGKESTTTVMPLLSAALYLGQFVSPLVVTPLSHAMFGDECVTGPYKVGIMVCAVFLCQVRATRHFQSLPPVESTQSKRQ